MQEKNKVDPSLLEETIAAVATPPGEGGVAIIRLSGKQALLIAEAVFSGKVGSYKSHTAHFGKILDEEGQTVDEVLVLPMWGSHSYTGEDTVEIHCHGGRLVTQRVLDTVLRAGARAAKPGEFTLRAFMNGKIDLSQAEAVQQLIHAKNTKALLSAQQHLEGRLSRHIRNFQERLTDIAAVLEAWVDFPEEGLEFMTKEEMLSSLNHTLQDMSRLSSTFHEGKVLSQGVSVCFVGLPNAGKSSLMNALLGKPHAIVTPIAGTTRDVLEAEASWGGLHFRLFDTAGIRDTEECIEKEGVRRSREKMQQADLVLLVLDASQPLSEETNALIRSVSPANTLLVWNKMDLQSPPTESPFAHVVAVSATQQMGLEELKAKMLHLSGLAGSSSGESLLITSSRHHLALCNACDALKALIASLEQNLSAEFASADMRAALSALGTIIGIDITEEILSSIFSKFCVGK